MARRVPTPAGVALTCLRSVRGWTQKELAEASGTPRTVLSDYETGRRVLPREKLEALAEGMGFAPDAVEAALRGWNQTALARASGIDKSLISRYEAGKQAPSRRNLERIATAVGTPLALVEPMIPVVRRIRDAVEGRLPAAPEEAQDSVEAALQAISEVIRGPLERAVAELRRAAERKEP